MTKLPVAALWGTALLAPLAGVFAASGGGLGWPVAGLSSVAAGLLLWRQRRDPAAQLAAALDALPCSVTVVSADGGALAGNAAAAALPAPDAAALASRGEEGSFDLAAQDGSWLRVVRRQLPCGAMASLGVDVTSLKAQAMQGHQADSRSRAVLQVAPVGLWQLDRAGRTVFANDHLARLCGGEAPADLAAGGFRLSGPPDPDGPLGLPVGREVEASVFGPDRVRRTVSVSASAWLPGPDGSDLCVLALLDITALKRAQARVEHLAEHDPLTGLPNRATFRAALGALVGGPEGGALLLLDLDGFRALNERHGQAAGDAVLRLTAERLRGAVRPQDLVCRLGADEFGVLAFGTGAEGAVAIAQRLTEALGAPVQRIEAVTEPLTAGIGIAVAPLHARDADDLLRAADLALEEARRTAAPLCPFRPELLAESQARALLREALGEALAGNEFHLAYQPQRDLPNYRLIGAEALIRWDSRRLGRAVSPGELLPAALEAGLMPALDAWVLEEALRQLAAWTDQPGAPPLLSINISGTTLRDAGFADRVSVALARHGVGAGRLEIEIPEDLAVRDLPAIAETIDRLAALGVRLALDDFGGGHSSLPHVVRLPVHRLKLDRSIVSGLPEDSKDRAVLNATMALARGMGIEVIGEGVETEAQAAALRRAGCSVLQGYLIARPMAADLLVPGRLRATG